MSRKLLAPLAIVLALALAACGGNPPEDTTVPPADAEPTAEPADPAVEPAEPVTPPAS